MIIIISIAGLLVAAFVFGRINLAIRFGNEVKQLFSASKSISGKTFHHSELSGLPDPVQRYFKHVIKDGQPYISYARIKHGGQFKTGIDKAWINIIGEQYATTEKPGFIWKGTTTLFTARDMYIADKGRFIVSLFSLFKVVDASGEQYDQGELLRWLGESVMYPTNLLPCERLQWSAIDSQSAKLTFDINGISLFFLITFNDVGEIIRMETKRYMNKTKLATWVIKCTGYKEMNNIIIPSLFEVIWSLENGDFSYAKFNVDSIEYNKPEKF